jgi:hypothetical protein
MDAEQSRQLVKSFAALITQSADNFRGYCSRCSSQLGLVIT